MRRISFLRAHRLAGGVVLAALLGGYVATHIAFAQDHLDQTGWQTQREDAFSKWSAENHVTASQLDTLKQKTSAMIQASRKHELQWVQDCSHLNYDHAPADGSAWQEGDCSLRILRGGVWMWAAGEARSAYRHSADPNHRGNLDGFRVARVL